MNQDTKVRLTGKNLGVLETPFSRSFVGGRVVTEGHVGIYHGRHPDPELGELGWHLVMVEFGDDPETYWCPVHTEQFEALG